MHIKRSGENINFDSKKIKKAFQIDDIDVIKILVSKKEAYGTKNTLNLFIYLSFIFHYYLFIYYLLKLYLLLVHKNCFR